MKYIPQSQEDLSALLSTIGVSKTDELFSDIPDKYRVGDDLGYPKAKSELELRNYFKEITKQSPQPKLSFAGCGIYSHDIPSIVPFLQGRSEFATSYTPYQPEISQGTLQAIYEFQSLAAQMTETELSNASLYDGATSLGEAVLMALRILKKSSGKILLSSSIHPNYLEVTKTYCEPFLDRFEMMEIKNYQTDLSKLEERLAKGDVDIFVSQSPNLFGTIEDYARIGELTRKNNTFWISSTMEALAFGMMQGPGKFGCEIVTAEGQSFGNSPYLAGTGFGLFCTKQEYIRNLPGRLVGETTDEQGRRSFVLTFATREQFIRRGRATSNICTNNNLNMLAGLIHLVTLGKKGLSELAQQNFSKTEYLKSQLSSMDGIQVADTATFNEFVVETTKPAYELVNAGLTQSWVVGVDLGRLNHQWKHQLLIHVNEQHSRAQLDQLAEFLKKAAR